MAIGTGGWLIRKRPSGGRLGVSPRAFAHIRKYRQDACPKPEAGGVLLGRRVLDSSDVVVDQVTTPFPSDVRRRHEFIRRERGHQDVVTRAWKESGGTTVYLGEWHTHPESIPQPSRRDTQGWLKKVGEVPGDGLFFLILGIDSVEVWEIREPERGPAYLPSDASD